MIEIVVLGSGSRGNCALLRQDGHAVMIDAGLSAREIARRCAAVGQDLAKIDAILLTHEHADHVAGVRVFAKRCGAVVAGNAATLAAAGLHFPHVAQLATFTTGQRFTAGRFAVTPFRVPHDAVEPVGFILEAEGVRVGYATDLGHVTPEVRARLEGCAAIVMESNHDREMLRLGPYPWVTKQRVASANGHLSNDHAAAALPDIVAFGTEHVVLAHVSETNNHPHLARAAVHGALLAAGRDRVRLEVAPQDRPATPVRL